MLNLFARLILISDVQYIQTDPLSENSHIQNGPIQGFPDA